MVSSYSDTLIGILKFRNESTSVGYRGLSMFPEVDWLPLNQEVTCNYSYTTGYTTDD
jgi:hypothetical protein